jgi:hypothetical protein
LASPVRISVWALEATGAQLAEVRAHLRQDRDYVPFGLDARKIQELGERFPRLKLYYDPIVDPERRLLPGADAHCGLEGTYGKDRVERERAFLLREALCKLARRFTER